MTNVRSHKGKAPQFGERAWVDPSAVVNKDYRLSIVQHADGRVLNGIVVSQDDARIELQTEKEKLTLLRDDIEQIKLTTLSAMPDSILNACEIRR